MNSDKIKQPWNVQNKKATLSQWKTDETEKNQTQNNTANNIMRVEKLKNH